MGRVARLVLVMLGLPGWSAVAGTADAAEPASPERVARLIRDLGANDYSARQQADEQLGRLGPDIRRELETALASNDAEVRLRAQRLLDRVKIAELWSPAIVKYAGAGEPVSKVFDALARQSGNHLSIGDQHTPAADARLSLALPMASFWESVDELCRRTGNRVRPNFDSQSPGLVVVSGTLGSFPTAYAGPLRVQLTSARRVFSEDLDYESGKSEVSHTFQLNMQMMWEDRLRLVAYTSQPELVEAVPHRGKALAAAQPQSSSWNVATSSTRQVSANLRIVPPPAAAKTLDVLRLRWGLVAVGDMVTAEIKPVEAKRRHQQGDFLMSVESVEQQSAARCDLCLIVARELALPEPQEILLEENSVALFDKQGHRYRLLSQSNSLNDQGVQMKLSFAGDSAESVPHALQITYPRLRSRREVEIVFRQVPLPMGLPE